MDHETRSAKRARAGLPLFARGQMSLLERVLIAIAAMLAVAALVLLMDLDIGRNAGIPTGGIVEQPAAPRR